MEPRLLMLGFLSLTIVPSCRAELCLYDPPEVPNATFKALSYKNGTILNCECKRGFRRLKELVYMRCLGNSWSSNCQCTSNSHDKSRKQVTAQLEHQKEQQTTTDMQKPTQSMHQENLTGHCREPPPWKHEDSKRIYHFVEGQSVHYECIPGYKALQRGPAISICKMKCGKTGWTQPQLTCVDEREHHRFLASEESQGSRNSSPESETSCPITTTDFPQPTETTAMTETFVLTMEYKVAVASCLFLLISILLLSGLTWQHRWRKSRRTI
ncbi:interleukin-2 receptor subunit alpha precursor [Mus musculus]|uniref:Interleukin-2 receptor subunit alpha n=3 Tax=Mus musculus TaxID=10090 RepID=IL2RA_MOUSE|nr:interleukin-2 receptor subunit alpha precursor [Mus musculus]P01590.1 RecName: Full=Interleukin-2 receptor subunit alpha; Short=IL-2 receptor subunit alpha; Short=IL-2-RA; Short=IL-2R subunit alpha; Short=IL2-RA; AltName: Full=p55; AltName: CD_antigen=CD25; Flags: Precursor [Mus musculus]AAA39285.1 interleukin 2 receptor [Mus musculus]AAI14438.1 Interleukin 2 receptor, alpha chain [Mus musculus]ABM01861.1 interleukin-2 receptor alpha subunit [Mus musculus]ABM01862.1 interleukin-2 receptor a|eukprot:NP_032393.3 interleukin-2 receptor subunit alpha precursor [Mus musculus]